MQQFQPLPLKLLYSFIKNTTKLFIFQKHVNYITQKYDIVIWQKFHKQCFSTLFCLENQNTQLEDATRKTKSVEFLSNHECLVHLQIPKCFGLVQIFCARPKIYLHIVAVTNILCQTKKWFAFSKIGFCASTKFFEKALNAVKFLVWLKKFGPAQNILGQGISQLLGYLTKIKVRLTFCFKLYSPKLNTYLWFQNIVRWARQKRRAQNLHFQFHELFCLVHFLYNDVHQRRKFCKISSGCQAAWTLRIWLLHKLLCSTRTKEGCPKELLFYESFHFKISQFLWFFNILKARVLRKAGWPGGQIGPALRPKRGDTQLLSKTTHFFSDYVFFVLPIKNYQPINDIIYRLIYFSSYIH